METIEFKMTWKGVLPMLLALVTDGDPDGRRHALEELRKMADLADRYVATVAAKEGDPA